MRYPATKPRLLALCLTAAACLVLGDATCAQDKSKDSKHLDALLKQLSAMDPAAWKAKIAALEATAAGFESRGKQLRRQAAASESKAAAARSAAARFKKVMALLARKTPPRPTPKKVVAKARSKKAAAKIATPKKPPPRKPRPKKPTAGKPAPKKPSPKAATPKRASAKKRAPTKSPAMAPTTTEMPAGGWVTYVDDVQEIFMDNCSGCHDADEKESGLDLTSFATARAGGSSGTTIVPGDIDRSRLYQLVAHLQRPTMPPDEPRIDPKHIDTIRRWILAGAPESKAGALAFAARKTIAARKPVVLQPRFNSPAPMPSGWVKVPVARTLRAVEVKALATSSRSPLLAIPGQGQVFLFNSTDRKPIGILPFGSRDIEVLAFSADGGRLLVAGGIAGKRGRVELFNIADGKVVGSFGREFDTVIAAAINPQLTHLALGGSNRKVKVYETSTGALAYEIEQHNEWILGVDFSIDGEFLVSCDRAGAIVLSDAKTGKNVDIVRRHRGAVNAVKFAPGGRTYATVGADSTLRLFSVKGARQITQRATGSPAMSVSYSPDGKMVAVGCRDGRPRVYRSNGAPLTTLASVGDWIYSIAFDKNNKYVFAGDWSGATSVFDLKTRKRVAHLLPSAPRTLQN